MVTSVQCHGVGRACDLEQISLTVVVAASLCLSSRSSLAAVVASGVAAGVAAGVATLLGSGRSSSSTTSALPLPFSLATAETAAETILSCQQQVEPVVTPQSRGVYGDRHAHEGQDNRSQLHLGG